MTTFADTCREAALSRLRRARWRADEASWLALSLGETDLSTLERARAQAASLGGLLEAGAAAVRALDVDELERSIEAVEHDLDAIAAFRREIDDRLDGSRRLLAELYSARRDGEIAYRTALVKIRRWPARRPRELGDDLSARLEEVGSLAHAGAWRRALEVHGEVRVRATDLLDEARAIAAANRAPLTMRDELRGLLAAYRAKAARLGLLHESELADRFGRARDYLYTAPTDLVRAQALVRGCQRALLGCRGSRVVPT